MFGTSWRILRVGGIPIYVDLSWLFILALATLTFAQSYPPLMHVVFGNVPALPPSVYWTMGLITALSFFVCILLHELGHAFVGRALGTPIRGITLFLFGGVAELGDEPPAPSSEFLMAIAGPVVSLALAVTLGSLAVAGSLLKWPPEVLLILGWLAFINSTVLIFNLIPAFPLDGGRVLRSLLWAASGDVRSATYWTALLGRVFAAVLIALGVLQFFRGFWMDGVWLALIGLFLNGAARSGYEQVVVRQALKGAAVRSFMNPRPIAVEPSLDLRHLVEDYIYRHHHKAFPVVSGDHLEGLVDTRALAQVPRGEWDRHTVGEVMRHDLAAITVSPDADALQALAKLRRSASNRLLVAEGGRLVGIVGLKDLLDFINLRMELEGDGAPGRAADGADVEQP
jgi:Zn-dependent protease/CBS domain-containing protein